MVSHTKLNSPRVSIVMPVRNANVFLRFALESLNKQSYRNLELIIIDDASTDQTAQVLKKYCNIFLTFKKNKTKQGVAASLNRGLKIAKGKYLARMDADDIALPHRLKKQVDYLETHQEVGVVGSWVELINEQGMKVATKKTPVTDAAIRRRVWYSNPLVHPAVMMRSDLYRRFGGYDERLEGAEDYDLWLRYLQFTKAINIPEPLLKYRLHPGGISYSESDRLNLAYARAQLKSIREYGYPAWYIMFAFKSYLSSLLPMGVRQLIYRRIFKY